MIKILGATVAIYVALLGLLYVFQRALIYLPDKTRPTPASAGVPEMQEVTLNTDDGLELVAWWRPPARPGAPVLAYFHGNGGHIGYRGYKVRPYLDRGWGVLLTTWRGYSGNPGKPGEAGLHADGRAALAFLDRAGVAPRQLVLYGESLGGGVAVALAAELGDNGSPPSALVLEAPFSSLADVAAGHYPIFPVRLLIRDRFDSLKTLGRNRAPVLVIHGENDRIIPVAHGRRMLEAAGAEAVGRFIAGAGHNDLYEFDAHETVAGFVQDIITN